MGNRQVGKDGKWRETGSNFEDENEIADQRSEYPGTENSMLEAVISPARKM